MSGSTRRQKRDELAQFSRFAPHCKSIPSGNVLQPAEPEPDIVVGERGVAIGIEFTDLQASGDSEGRGVVRAAVVDRSTESEREMLLASAQQLHRQKGRVPVNVFVEWAREPRLSKTFRPRLAAQLSELIELNSPTEVTGNTIGNGFEHIRRDLPILCLQVFPASSHEGSVWRDGGFHEILPLQVPIVRARIRQEEPKLDRYLEQYAGVWLVLVTNAAGPSTWTTVTEELLQSTFETRYDRVFLLSYVRAQCHELHVCRVQAADT